MAPRCNVVQATFCTMVRAGPDIDRDDACNRDALHATKRSTPDGKMGLTPKLSHGTAEQQDVQFGARVNAQL